MSVSNPNLSVSRQDLADFYDKIFPYLGGKAAAGFTPVGTVISIMGVTAPANYLACDGTVYNISDYPELARYFGQQFSMVNKFGGDGTTTFAVPNLQGEFLRGAGTNSHANQGNGASVGVHQDATTHSLVNPSSDTSIVIYHKEGGENGIDGQNSDKRVCVENNVISAAGSFTLKGVTATGTKSGTALIANQYTSRPTNTSVLWCIATKNIYMNPSLDYSTDEKVVGSWITGKPIYQKTIEVNDVTRTATQGTRVNTDVDISSLNLDKLIDVRTIATLESGTGTNFVHNQVMIPSVADTGTTNSSLSVVVWNNDTLRVQNSTFTSQLTMVKLHITICYTKTTD